jgi:predicted negative regulator of RcsB-dependent stress response
MNSRSGSATTLVTILALVVLGLGALVGWQWHRSQMEKVLLDKMVLEKNLEDLDKKAKEMEQQLNSLPVASASATPTTGISSDKESTASSTQSSRTKTKT